MKYRLAHVCGGIPESKGPANRLICKSVVELHWETYMQVRCQKHAHYFGRFAKVMCKAHPAEGLYAPIQRKSYMSGCLHTANACSYILNLQLYIWGQIHLSIMIWAESLADAWSSRLFHEMDKCNVVLTTKTYEWKKNRGDNIRAGYCNESWFNTMHNSMHHDIRKFKLHIQRTFKVTHFHQKKKKVMFW